MEIFYLEKRYTYKPLPYTYMMGIPMLRKMFLLNGTPGAPFTNIDYF